MRLVKVLVFIAGLALGAAAPSVARADGFALLPEGAPVYGVLRWGAILQEVARLGWNKLPAYDEFKSQNSNIDLLNPTLYAPTGLDINAPFAAAAEGAATLSHVRIVGRIADKGMFITVVSGTAEDKTSGIKVLPSTSPGGKVGIVATGKLDKWTGILRIADDQAVLDLVTGTGAKLLTPEKIAAKYALKPAVAVVATSGTRALLGGDRLAALTVDGKRPDSLAYLLATVVPREKGELPLAQCLLKVKNMATTFDGAGAALTLDGNAPQLEVAWGSAQGGLKFAPTDDGVLNMTRIRKESVAHLALYGATMDVFRKLTTTGVPALDKLDKLVDQCPTTVGANLLLRSWPQTIAASVANLDKNPQDLGAAAGALGALNQIRSLMFAMRSVPSGDGMGPWVVAASAGDQFRTIAEGLFGMIGLTGAQRAFGTRKVTFFDGSQAGGGMKFVAAMLALPTQAIGLVAADNEQVMTWAFGSDAQKAAAGTGVPLATAHMDGALLLSFNKSPEDQKYLQAIRRLEGELRSDDLFRAILRIHLN